MNRMATISKQCSYANGHTLLKMATTAAVRLTRNEDPMKVRIPIGMTSDWLVDAGVSGFCDPASSWASTAKRRQGRGYSHS